MSESTFSRRLVLGGAALGAGALATSALSSRAGAVETLQPVPRRTGNQKSMIDVPFEAREKVRVGVIGLGNRGQGMALGWAAVPGAEVVAVCDIRAERASRTAKALVDAGHASPKEFGGNAKSFQQMLNGEELDLVYIATPWEFHFPQAKAALLAGAHVGVELPIATELGQLWDLVDTSEKTGRHLWLMENCSYGRNELAMLRMAHDGYFGDITSGHGGYLHDLRALLFDDGYYTDDWRRLWHTRSIASFYPMHGLAPIAAAMDVNRGDRMLTLQATATAPRGLAEYRKNNVPRGHRSWKEEYINGDQITCLIGTDRGRIIRAEHDVSSPRPYSRINTLAGSRGIFEDYAGSDETGARVYGEPGHQDDAWHDFLAVRNEYDHWLWKELADEAENGGHGGMDYVLQWRVIQTMRAGLVPDIDVYDSASWCAPVPLSVASLERDGRAVEIPDFTRGDWKARSNPGLDSKQVEMPPVA